MRRLSRLLLSVAMALVSMAVLSASASALTVSPADTLTATTATDGAVLNTDTVNVTCTSDATGTVTSDGTGSIDTLVFTTCSGGATATVTSGLPAGATVDGTEGAYVMDVNTDITVRVQVGFITCTFSSAATMIQGDLSEAAQTLAFDEIVTDPGFCTDGNWTAVYAITPDGGGDFSVSP